MQQNLKVDRTQIIEELRKECSKQIEELQQKISCKSVFELFQILVKISHTSTIKISIGPSAGVVFFSDRFVLNYQYFSVFVGINQRKIQDFFESKIFLPSILSQEHYARLVSNCIITGNRFSWKVFPYPPHPITDSICEYLYSFQYPCFNTFVESTSFIGKPHHFQINYLEKVSVRPEHKMEETVLDLSSIVSSCVDKSRPKEELCWLLTQG